MRAQQNILGDTSQHAKEEQELPIAFVLINTEIGSESEVLKALKGVEGVMEAYAVFGVYDVLAKITADSMDKLKEVVTWS